MPKFDAIQASLKAAAVGGIFILWVNITIEAFKLSWHIISNLPEKKKLWRLSEKPCVIIVEMFMMMTILT